MPPPFAAEADNAAAVSRRAVPFVELTAFYDDMAEQMKGVGDCEIFRLSVSD